MPVSSDLCSQDLADCMFPDLVFCTVPVEQILPSILTMSWSRGMGHLVRAQNIHTIGNLSALKEEQVPCDIWPIRQEKQGFFENVLFIQDIVSELSSRFRA